VFRDDSAGVSHVRSNVGGKIVKEISGKSVRRMSERRTVPRAVVLVALVITGFGFAGVAGVLAPGPAKIAFSSGEIITPFVPGVGHTPGVTSAYGPAVQDTTSTNWAGYADSVPSSYYGHITKVLGQWTVPKITCPVYEPAIQDNWVGIDGFTTDTVEQGGTIAECSVPGEPAAYYDWYEFYPYEAVITVNAVSPGDAMQGQVTYAASTGVYTITITDKTNTAASFTYVGSPTTCSGGSCETGPDGSAECISESLTGEGYFLPDYGTSTFHTCQAWILGYHSGIGGLPSGAHATVWAITQDSPITGDVQQSISGLGTHFYTDDRFSVTWKSYE
jgi:hypothetical protein